MSYVHGVEELKMLKCPHYLKQSTDSIQSPIKILMAFHRNGKAILNFTWYHKRSWTAKGTTLSDFKAIVTKTAC